MGYVLAYGECFCCRQPFGFNPKSVPSIRVEGVRVPLCRECVEYANEEREQRGLPLFELRKDAYEPVDEVELG